MKSLGVLDPRITAGRLVAGVFAGMAGGVALGIPFSAILIAQAQTLLGSLDAGIFWFLHMIISVTLGVVFSVFIAPRSYGASLVAALVYVMVFVYGGQKLILYTFAGASLTSGLPALVEVFAHVVFAVVLGLVYVAFHREVVRDALDAENPRVHRWGEEEERATRRRS